jgi:hypothetical protein
MEMVQRFVFIIVIIIIIIIITITIITYLLPLSFHPMAIALTLVQNKP